MQCPKCKHAESQVVDSRETQDGIRRRRACLSCKHRFTTYERIELPTTFVLKKDGSRERFNPEKVRRGVATACKNRPVTEDQIDDVVSEVEQRVCFSGRDDICSHDIGDIVREVLEKLDPVAYVRFVSVYEGFEDVKDFAKTINTLR